jgi:FkbM family methyltransferase
LSLNHASNVFPERLALSDFKGESDLFLCPDPKSVCHSLNQGVTGTRESERVTVTTLDAHLAQVSDCDLLLIDTEGHDMKVLNGGRQFIARQERKPLVIVEFAPQFWSKCGSTAEQFVEFAHAMGYRAFADFGNNFSPVSGAALIELFKIWKDTCQAWLDVYLVERGAFNGIFPNPW